MPSPRAFDRRVKFPAIAAILASSVLPLGCGSSGQTATSPSSVSKCAVAVDAPASTLPAAGGTGSLAVKTARECQWTAQPEVNWLSITAGTSGQGDGAVQFNATANGDPVARSGGVMVNGQRAQVTQAASECRFELSDSSASFAQTGGSGSVNVRASSPLCTWTASSSAGWISITSTTNGTGSAAVTFTVAPTTGAPRTGTLRIAGRHFNVTQSEGCTYSVAPTSYSVGASGGSQAVTVTAGAGCPWTASSDADWITPATPGGTGPGRVTLNVAATTGPTRSGTVTIAGHALAVTQSPGCSFEVAPLTHDADPTGGSRTVNVTAAAGCAWSASSPEPWITITSGASGNGPGSVTFAVAAASGPPRSGTLVVANQTVTVTQGNGCAFGISPDTRSVPSSGGSASVAVTGGAGCAWTAARNVSWITITSGASGSGNGTVNFTVAATSGPSRSGTLTIAGRTFTVNQGQGCTSTLSAESASVHAGGGGGTFDVRTADGCGWTAASSANWLTVTAGANGNGNGTVRYTAAANAGPQRTATITAGGETHTVTQGGGCSYSIAPGSRNVASGGETIPVAITAAAGCSWNASTTDTWISFSGASSGSGNGTVNVVIAPNPGGERRGTATIASQPFTVTQSGGCTFSIVPPNQTLPATGGSGSFAVNTAGGCDWTAKTDDGWISITSGSGSGAGTVQFTAAANMGGPRQGSIKTGDQTFTLSQEGGCSATVTPDPITLPAAGGAQNVSVNTSADCPWTASTATAWIAIAPPAAGTGNGTVQLDIQANTGPARSGSVTIALKTVSVNQASGCAIVISPTAQSMPAAAGTGSVTVTTAEGCAWNAASNNADWLKVTSAPAVSGAGTVQYTVDANATGATRIGTITIGGQVLMVTQAGL